MRETDFDPIRLAGGDLGDEESVVLIRGGKGVGAIVPASMSRLRGHQLELVSELQDLAAQLQRLQLQLDQLVQECREEGVSWGAIGWSVGLSDRGAAKRWGEDQ